MDMGYEDLETLLESVGGVSVCVGERGRERERKREREATGAAAASQMFARWWREEKKARSFS